MTRNLIVGGSGNLGRPLSNLSAAIADTTSTYFHNSDVGGGQAVQVDIRDGQAVRTLVADLKPEVILYAAGSERSDDMVTTNRAGATNICQAARQTDTRLIALSSDLVFDGSAPPYAEEAPPTPLSPYGSIKAENERLFTSGHDNCLVVRTSVIYDFNRTNRQAKWLEDKVKNQERISLFVDEIRQPIWAWNLAEILLELAATTVTGVLNVAGPRSLSRWDFGCALLRALGHDPDAVAYRALAAHSAPNRPRDCTLSLTRARSILKAPLLDFEQALTLSRSLNLSGGGSRSPGSQTSAAP